jgi:hypothetical protein
MISQPCGHGGCHNSTLTVLAQFMMGPAEIRGTANQIHARMQCLQTTSRMTALTGEGCQPLPHRAIEAFNEGGVGV